MSQIDQVVSHTMAFETDRDEPMGKIQTLPDSEAGLVNGGIFYNPLTGQDCQDSNSRNALLQSLFGFFSGRKKFRWPRLF